MPYNLDFLHRNNDNTFYKLDLSKKHPVDTAASLPHALPSDAN
jgi:hypothetical protein